MSKAKSPPQFTVGDAVRVKPGIADPDFDDMPIGGRAGTISEVQYLSPPMYLVRWNQRTLDHIHPVHKTRCERDGFDCEEMWLLEEDLEPDTGKPLEIEQPTNIVTKPLSMKNQDDRIRMISGLTSDDPLPNVDDDSLLIYHKHLLANLKVPFNAEHGEEYGHPEKVKVIGLSDPDEEAMLDNEGGILCDVRAEGHVFTLPLNKLEDPKGKPNRQLVNDYCYWFWNWQ